MQTLLEGLSRLLSSIFSDRLGFDIGKFTMTQILFLLVCIISFSLITLLVQFAQAVRPLIENTGFWEFTRVLAKTYDYGMGVALFAPIAVFSWLPIISAFQTRFLFNEAFNRHLQIQPILAGKKKNR